MEGMSRKRSSSSFGVHQNDRAKRQRTSTHKSEPVLPDAEPEYEAVNQPSSADVGRDGLRRAVVLSLQQVGFDSATNEALEGLTETVDTCACDSSAWVFYVETS